ncbi:MAG: RNA-binding transcriptional accessory protein [Anaerolineae bacterium]|nr:RNA-binding transcriptional accessory protein [Anaerolineae bacterium]
MTQPPYDRQIAARLGVQPEQVAATIALLDEGNTVPFIARYRKEVTGGLQDETIQKLTGLLERLRALDERRAAIIKSIEEQGKMTPALLKDLEAAETLAALEDLYAPYRPKRRTRATIAREKGLQGLADLILAQPHSPQSAGELAASFLNDEVPTVEEALAGARDIVAEAISESAQVRGELRARTQTYGRAQAARIEGAEDPKRTYETYYEFEYRIGRLRPYQVLAINRGEAEKVLRVHIAIDERDWQEAVALLVRPDRRSPLAEQLLAAADDAARRLLIPAIERDVRRLLTEQAEEHAIQVFATNLGNLLSQPPLAGHVVLGIDPAYRTGCKIAVVDPTGKVIDTATIYPHEPQRRWREAAAELLRLIQRHGVTLVAIGNGTASRETEQLVAEITRQLEGVHYLLVSEAGASVYSASALAREELPDLDVTLRGAVSIARRAQDPLAELVKIDPKAIGVGMYQHDVDQKRLAAALDAEVEKIVNRVGVDVNTASAALLRYVAGIGPKLAANIVAYREEHGPFTSRAELRKVPGLGPKAYQQAAGFLRIRGGRNPLDASAIHPESYAVAEAVLKAAGVTIATPPATREAALRTLLQQRPLGALAEALGVGVPTLTDIFEQLIRPGRDPREDLPTPILRSDVLRMEDLQAGMIMQGTVRNVVDFGAFVDIGVKQDGLLHTSRIPKDVLLAVGDVIAVEILSVDLERGRISLGWAG